MGHSLTEGTPVFVGREALDCGGEHCLLRAHSASDTAAELGSQCRALLQAVLASGLCRRPPGP